MNKISLDHLRQRLPTSKSPEDRATRKKLFKSIDQNGNGVVSLAELIHALKDTLKVGELYLALPVVSRAFEAAKACSKSKRGKVVRIQRRIRFICLATRLYFL